MADYDFLGMLEAAVRWIHVFAAILWIGQTYLFNFMERSLEPSEDDNVSGNLWMVHGGGFYLVEKQRLPKIMPMTLHWFKYEALATWVSGVVLITLRYYMGGLLVEPGQSFWVGTGVAVGAMVVGWLVYDVMVRSPLGRNERIFAVVGLVLLMAVHFGFLQFLSSRAAFLHIGALLGTIMFVNVWNQILPSQRKMIALAEKGKRPEQSLMATGPLRSKHNSYMVVPLVFIMISNHYPSISYGSDQSTLVLGALLVVGWIAARILRG